MNYGAELKSNQPRDPPGPGLPPPPPPTLGGFVVLHFNCDGAEEEYAPLPDHLTPGMVHHLSLPWDVIQEPVCACASLGERTLILSPCGSASKDQGRGLPLGLVPSGH